MIQKATVVACGADDTVVPVRGDHDAQPPVPFRALAVQEVAVAPGLRHLELFTLEGLLTLLWHDSPTAETAVVMCGGAMGGLLGPADGLYHDLGVRFATTGGIDTVRVGYRRPGDLPSCIVDVAVAVQLVTSAGARRVVVVGHSFGGAVAVRVGVALPDVVAGVVTLATQSAGCEVAPGLRGRPVLVAHGDADELLPLAASETVCTLAGGELVVLAGTGHLLIQASGELRDLLGEWIPRVLAG